MSADGRKELLYIEDNEDDVFAMRRSLPRTGHDIELWHQDSVTGALDELRSRAHTGLSLPRLALVDLNLPGSDGRSFVVEMRADRALCHLPMIVWSSSAARADVLFAARAGARAYHVKPTKSQELVDTLTHLLNYWLGTIEAQ